MNPQRSETVTRRVAFTIPARRANGVERNRLQLDLLPDQPGVVNLTGGFGALGSVLAVHLEDLESLCAAARAELSGTRPEGTES